MDAHERKDIDKDDMFKVLEDFPKQCEEALEFGKDVKVGGEIDMIVVAGMGGSALPGTILQTLFDLKIPIHICREYFLPATVTRRSLVFAISYSGNTEETISLFRNAKRIGSKIIAISAGGKLEEISKASEVTHIKIPSGIQPRSALGYMLSPILNVLENSNIIPPIRKEYLEAVKSLPKPEYIEMSRELAKKLKGHIPLIYSSNRFGCVAYKWKINFNENSKVHAFCNYFPEFNHNEINGYVNLSGQFYAIMLHDDEEYLRIKRRMQIIKEMIKGKGVKVTEIMVRGESMISKILSAIYIGDWTSYWLAIENKTNPTPVKIIEELKKKLAE
ncbi:bifunctional phosphoglucose/phosphomannose isomerase [Candidatus Woesearchaeota archaeon]|nr:bifunctional phosphoglucose/phosphomannose isomerase [Candidatus Woesearchaeota archaeon]